MGLTQFKIGSYLYGIWIKDDDPVYLIKVRDILRQIGTVNLGLQLFADITTTGKKVVIYPTVGSNKCTSGTNARFYRLRAAFYREEGMSVQTELRQALMGAAQAGWTTWKIGLALAGGMSPVTVRTMHNLRNPVGQTEAAGQVLAAALQENPLQLNPARLRPFAADPREARFLVAAQLRLMIEKVADGKESPSSLHVVVPHGQYRIEDLMIRFLRPWLKPGTGAASRIDFNADRMEACTGDRKTRRPPAIGLAHELCHAWRNAVGQRLFLDRDECGLDDDEVMTTGFPPYEYEKYTENRFRVLLAPGLALRLDYRT